MAVVTFATRYGCLEGRKSIHENAGALPCIFLYPQRFVHPARHRSRQLFPRGNTFCIRDGRAEAVKACEIHAQVLHKQGSTPFARFLAGRHYAENHPNPSILVSPGKQRSAVSGKALSTVLNAE
jgi:hypothetical protein